MRDAPARVPPAAWLRRLREFFLFTSLLLNPSRRRANVLYEAVSTTNYLTDKTLFRNVGYWKNSPGTLDDACEALAQFTGDAAALCSTDHVLDAGFGFGDQDLYWMQHFSPQRIVGLNVTRSQVEHARARVAARALSARIELLLAPATQMPFGAGSFDKVIALESAFHFSTRDDFFREAFRVLKPGGRLVTLDLVPMPDQKPSLYQRLWAALSYRFWQMPAKNMYCRRTYFDRLQAVGFEPVDVRSIRDETIVPFSRYSLRELWPRVLQGKINPGFAAMIAFAALSMLKNPFRMVQFDYIVAVADKPRAIATDRTRSDSPMPMTALP